MHFLLGYSEQLLSYWLHCPVKMEIVTIANKDDVVYKIIQFNHYINIFKFSFNYYKKLYYVNKNKSITINLL